MVNVNRSADIVSTFRRLLLLLGIAGTLVTPAWADGLREVDQTIFGMDCAPCAAGVEQGLSKLQGVTSVRVSLNEGKAVVVFAPNSRTTLAQIREVIRHNGFTPKDARATLVGRVLWEGDRWWIASGAERFVLTAEGSALEGQARSADTHEEVTLSVRVPEELIHPPTVQLIGFEPKS